MSLHAQLNPEAEARFEAQKRNSMITSIVISLLTVTLVVLVLLYILLPAFRVSSPPIVTYSAGSQDDEQLDQRKINDQIKRQPSAPSSSMAKVIASSTPSPTAIPVPDMQVPDPSTDFGSGDDFGAGWGSGGDGGGGGFGNIPTTMKKRCSKADRLQRLTSNGGTEKCEDAVIKALDWFKGNQGKDGSWGGGYKVGTTGLALLAFLGHCETPLSPDYGETVENSIVYLVDIAIKNKGKVASDLKGNPWVYEHAIATYALAEAYTFCKQLGVTIPNLHEAVQGCGQTIIDGQNSAGGWTYQFSEAPRNDTSVMGWCLQALKACKHTGIEYRNLTTCVRKGLDAIQGNQAANGAIGYTNASQRGDGTTLSSIGALCFQMWDKGSHSVARKACALVGKNIKCDWADKATDLYGHYYASQAMINHGGKTWDKYNKLFRDEVLKNQNADGSFKAPVHSGHGGGDVHRRTAFCTLMLEVYYRFLPGTGQK